MISAPAGILAVGSEHLEIPSSLPSPSPGSGEVVLLLADADVSRTGWSARVAIEVVRYWAASGAQVILADGDLLHAPLHGEVGVENTEGVSDLLLYGSSPYRVSRKVEGEDFLLIPAGTVVSDSEKVLRHERWPGLLAAFRESGCVLVLYLPSDLPGYEALLPEGDRILRLSSSLREEAPEPGVLTLVPEVKESEVAVEEVEVSSEELPVDLSIGSSHPDTEERESVPISGEVSQEEASVLPPPIPSEAASTIDQTPSAIAIAAAAMERPRTPAPKKKGPWILLILLIVAGGLLLLGWLGFLPLPGMPAGISLLPNGEEPYNLPTLFASFG